MERGPASTALRRVFARIAEESAWDAIAENDAARMAVQNFVDESRRDGKPVYEIIIETLDLAGGVDRVGGSPLETVVRWVVDAFHRTEGA